MSCPDGDLCRWCNEPEEPEEEEVVSKEVFYVAHPVSGDIKGNIQNVISWIRWLTLNVPERIYIAPWVAEVQAFSQDIGVPGADADPAFYDRVLADDCDVVRHCDGIFLVGGHLSRGMGIELKAAEDAGLMVDDWRGARQPPKTPEGSRAMRELILTGFHAYQFAAYSGDGVPHVAGCAELDPTPRCDCGAADMTP